MNNEQILAITKAIKSAAATKARNGIRPGVYNVDILLRIAGALTVNRDETYTPTVDIPLKATLALFIRFCGITREAAKAALVRAMTEALAQDEKGDDKTARIVSEIGDVSIIDDCMAQVLETLDTLPDKTRKGKVLTNLHVTEITNDVLLRALNEDD